VLPRQARRLEGKVVIDPSNPLGFDASGQPVRTLPEGQSQGSLVVSLLPAGTHYVKAFGTLAAPSLEAAPTREPRAVLFYATDDDEAAAAADRLIRAAGVEPLKAGGLADVRWIEMPGGDLHQASLNGAVLDLDEAQALLAK
jgi:8-hydroxy-5-deazaflavin:NADPH oxidoreductase